MQISSMTISTNDYEYCRYEQGREQISVNVVFTGTVVPDTDSLVITIRRPSSSNWPDEFCSVMKRVVPMTTAINTSKRFSAVFSLGQDDLDKDMIARAITGYYVVQVHDLSNESQKWQMTKKISVLLVSTKTMKSQWCFGVPLKAAEVLSVRFQPVLITGLVITEISSGIIPGLKKLELKYFAPNWTLAIGGADAISISASSEKNEYIITDESNINYMIATIDASLLPLQNVIENVLIAESSMTDEIITHKIAESVRSVESKLGFPIEPYLYTCVQDYIGDDETDMGTLEVQKYWDRVGRPSDYVTQVDLSNWPTFRLPYQWCLKLHNLYGYHSTTKILSVSGKWFNASVDRMSGLVTLIPSANTFASWTMFSHPLLSPFYMRTNIPGFWRYTATFGLPDLEQNDRAVVRELVARVAASSILLDAQRAYQGGLSGESTSRDGLSSSRSYNPGGPYASTIQAHEQWIAAETPRIKTKLGGLLLGVIGS